MLPALFLFLSIDLALRGLLWHHMNFSIVFSMSVKNAIGIFIEIVFSLGS